MLGSMTDTIVKTTSDTVTREVWLAFLDRKIRQAGIKPSKTILNRLADHFIAESNDEFDLPEKYAALDNPDFFNLSDDDESFLAKLSKRLTDAQTPVVKRLVKMAPSWLLGRLISNWPKRYALEEKDAAGFKKRLRKRWGKALDNVRMLLTISREIGAENYKRFEASPKPRSLKTDVLLRLHIRGCQVADEIIKLMENGFADGAMARWRTLHEIFAVASLIAAHDEELAERYLAHDSIEAKKAADFYTESHEALGFEPISQAEIDQIDASHANSIVKYGPEFKEDYGWAAKHLNNKRPTFFAIIDAAGQSHMKPYYKMASYNVHAGTRGIGFKHGALAGYPPMLAGASNAGFEEPVQNTAISLLELTSLLFKVQPDPDEPIFVVVMAKLKDRATNAALKAGQKLVEAERKFHENVTKQASP